MAGTSSSLVWVVIGLLLVPLVALGADAIQRGLESETFPTAPLHADERYVYDVSVLSDFTAKATTAREHIEIVIGDLGPDAEAGAFEIRAIRSPAPWDVATRPLWEDEKQRVDARLDVVVTESIDLDKGQVLVSSEESHEEHWYTHDDATYRYALESDATGNPGRVPGVASAVARVAGATWTHDVPMFGRSAAGGPHDLPLAGTYDGRTVYGRNVTTSEVYPVGGAPFGCDLEAPAIPYGERGTTAKYAPIPVQVDTTRVEWRTPSLALPVVVECHRAYINSADGADMGHIRVIANLVTHDAGGAAHGIDWADDLAPLPTGHHTAVPTVAAGVPADYTDAPEPLGDERPTFRFPLVSAHTLASDWLDAELSDFASPGTTPYALVAATYWPGTETTAACTGLPEDIAAECGLLPTPLQSPQQAFVEPHWYLSYENGNAERVVVQALRNMTTTGQEIEDFVSLVAERHPSPAGPMMHRVPDRLVPVHDMFAAWLEEEDVSIEAWREQEAARFEYRLEPSAQGAELLVRPIYAFRQGQTVPSTATNTHPLAPDQGRDVEYLHQTTETCTYLASDGALVDKRNTDFLVEDAEARATQSGPASYVLPEETSHRPVAAVVVGILGLGAVAVGATPGARTWLRGLLALPLFTKLSKDEVLEHRTRESMLGYVTANPGVGTEEIRRHLDIGWGTAVYHLSALEQNGLLSSMRRGGNRHWFAAGLGRAHDREAIALLRSAAARRLHDAIRGAPGRTQQELAAQLGVTHGAVIFQVRKLEHVGLIRKERDGRFVRYFATAAEERVPNGNAS